ncbi:hypothetical protein ANO11243_000350 [Dothideomycetidae sp. 11243]|nr:hypothetical protein ANO11243_000350 [fungal sp. No.11243]
MSNDVRRLHTNDLEIGATDAVQKHFERHVVATKPVSQRKLDFEHRRPRWLREMFAEATGVFFYGWAFALGIAFAIIVCAPTSGGHFNPAITIAFATWQGFPWRKVPYYIFSQIFGAFMAGLIVYGQYHQQIAAYTETLTAAGIPLVFNGGPASIFCSFPSAAPIFKLQQTHRYLFLIEFFVDSYISKANRRLQGLVIWACLDPANPFIAPTSAPFAIGLVYATMVWGFANITISTNLARDLGTRIVAAIFFGREAFSYQNYSPIAILVNIPATLFATGYYEMVMRDSLQKIGKGAAVHEGGEEGLALHLTKSGIGMDHPTMEKGYTNATGYQNEPSASGNGASDVSSRKRGIV